MGVVCTSIAEVVSEVDFGVMVGFGVVIVENVSCSCNVESCVKEELVFGIRV